MKQSKKYSQISERIKIVNNQQKNTKVQDVATLVYVVSFFCYLLASRIIPISYMLSGVVNTILSSAFAGIGAILILADLCTKRNLFQNKNSWLLILFIVAVGITSVINMKFGVTDNIKTIVWICIYMFIIYSLCTRFDSEKSKKLFKILISILSIVWFVCVIISIVQYCLQIGYLAPETETIMKRQGFYDNRLFGIFLDPNFAAVISMCIIFFSIHEYKTVKHIFMKVCYLVSAIVQYVYVILSGSRTVLICFFAGVVLWVALWVRNFCVQKQVSTKQWIYRELFSIVIVSLLFGGIYLGSREALSYLPLISGEQGKVNSTHAQEILKREDVKEDNMLNNRGTIWSEYVKSLEPKEYIIGLSPRNTIARLETRDPKGYVAKTQYTPHSDYVALLIYTGVVGCIIVLLFYFKTFIDILKKIGKKVELDSMYITSLVVAVSLIIYGIAFLDIYFSNTITAFLFWFAMSYIQKSNSQIYEQGNM